VNAESRVAALRERLISEGEGAIALTNPVNVAYITGFDGVFDEEEAHVALVTPDSLELFTDGRYAAAASRAAEGTAWRMQVIREDLLGAVCTSAKSASVDSLAVEDTMPYVRFAKIRDTFKGDVSPGHEWVEQLRSVKDSEEIARVNSAQVTSSRWTSARE